MTEIRVFGKPKSEIIEILRESIQKLDLNIPEIYLAFARKEKDLRRYREKFGKVSIANTVSTKVKIFVETWVKRESLYSTAAYVSEMKRKENFPPIIIVNLGSKIPEIKWEESVFHEVLHLKEETLGWIRIEEMAGFKAMKSFCLQLKDAYISSVIFECLSDFFGYEIACQYSFTDYVLRHKKRFIYVSLKEREKKSEEERIKWFTSESIGVFDSIIYSAFAINLPPSYQEREKDQAILEREFSPILSYIPKYIDFKSLASLPSQIKVPPEEGNLLKIYGKIFLVYNDFLNHFV